ncbi:MAG: hypothetical protein WC222_07195 [Parachlamydiales bacterium]|jgi:hypothetical protein
MSVTKVSLGADEAASLYQRGLVGALARSSSMKTNMEAFIENYKSLDVRKSASTPNHERKITEEKKTYESIYPSSSEEDCSPFVQKGSWVSDVQQFQAEKKNRRLSRRIEELFLPSNSTRSTESWNTHIKDSVDEKTKLNHVSSLRTLFAGKSFHTLFREKLKDVNASLPRLMTPSTVDDIVEKHILETVKDYFLKTPEGLSTSVCYMFSETINNNLRSSDLLIYPLVERAKFVECSICNIKEDKKSKKEPPASCIAKISKLKKAVDFLVIWNLSRDKLRQYILELTHQDQLVAKAVIERISWWLSKEGISEVNTKVKCFVEDYISLSNPVHRRYHWHGANLEESYLPLEKVRWEDAQRVFLLSSPFDTLKKKYFVNGESISFHKTDEGTQSYSLFKQLFENLIQKGLGRGRLSSSALEEEEHDFFLSSLIEFFAHMCSTFQESVLTIEMLILLRPRRLNEILEHFENSFIFLSRETGPIPKFVETEYYFSPRRLRKAITAIENIVRYLNVKTEATAESIFQEIQKIDEITFFLSKERDSKKLALDIYLDPVKYKKILIELLSYANSLSSFHSVKSILIGLLSDTHSFLESIRPFEELKELLANPKAVIDCLKENTSLNLMLKDSKMSGYVFANPLQLSKMLLDPNGFTNIFQQAEKFTMNLHTIASYMDKYPELISGLTSDLLDVFVMTTATGAFAGSFLFEEEKHEIFKVWSFKTRRLEKCNITIKEDGNYTVTHFLRCSNEDDPKAKESGKAMEFFIVSEVRPTITTTGEWTWEGTIHVPYLSRGTCSTEDKIAQWQIDRKLVKNKGTYNQNGILPPGGLEVVLNSQPLFGATLDILKEYARV